MHVLRPLDVPSHHCAGQLLNTGLGGVKSGDNLPLAQDGDAVTELHQLIHFVGDEDDRFAVGLELLDDAEQVPRLPRRQYRRRLVQDQDAGAAKERLDDLHPLLLPHGHIRHPLVQIYRQAVPVNDLLHSAPVGLPAEEGIPLQLQAQNDVLQRCEHGNQHKVLMNHADAAGDGRLGRCEPDLPAINIDLAGIRLVEAVQNAHQYGFSGTILT